MFTPDFERFDLDLTLELYRQRRLVERRRLRALLDELEKPMGLKLQGLAAKVAKLEHDAEFEAEKLDKKVEDLSAKMPSVFSGAHGAVDSLASTIGDVETSFKAIQSVTNGGPALNAPAPAPAPVAPPPLAPGAPSNPQHQ